MNRLAIVVVAAAAAWLLASMPAHAQGPAAPGSPLALLNKERVRKELKLSDEQTATVKRLYAEVKKDPTAAKAAFDTLGKTLQPAQSKRLKQISYQVRGGAAIGDSDVAKALKMTPKQKKEVAAIWNDEEKTLKMLLKVSRFRNSAVRQTFINNHRKKAGEKMLAALTETQRKEFARLQGDAFDTTGLDVE
jgi:hypothetical protein